MVPSLAAMVPATLLKFFHIRDHHQFFLYLSWALQFDYSFCIAGYVMLFLPVSLRVTDTSYRLET